MSNIQKTLDSLQPYVIGIRYLEGMPVVDVVFKPEWSVQEDPRIKMMKGNDEVNYYMLFSEVKGIGLDELLGFVDKNIKLNICLLYTSPSPRDGLLSRMPSSA